MSKSTKMTKQRFHLHMRWDGGCWWGGIQVYVEPSYMYKKERTRITVLHIISFAFINRHDFVCLCPE